MSLVGCLDKGSVLGVAGNVLGSGVVVQDGWFGVLFVGVLASYPHGLGGVMSRDWVVMHLFAEVSSRYGGLALFFIYIFILYCISCIALENALTVLVLSLDPWEGASAGAPLDIAPRLFQSWTIVEALLTASY